MLLALSFACLGMGLYSPEAVEPVAGQGPPAPPPAPAPASQDVEAPLDQLEAAAKHLRTFTADLRYWKRDAVKGQTELRSGSILYEAAPEAKRLAIGLDEQFVSGRKQAIHKDYLFDGSWLAEIDHDQKLFIKRQIVPPDRVFDPLKLGEGPFPLPIGQPKAEVLARFEVAAIDPPAEGQLTDLAADQVHGLRLIPRAGTPEADDFARVDLYYDRSTLLPVGIITVSARQIDPADPHSRDVKTVRLLNLTRNEELSPSQRQRMKMIEPDPTVWTIDIRAWRE
ncbi:MAG: hypothetical protein L0271_05655 [Gemmatimonadetes bacterium]|nr:hypothetical protein [Gemmatimonadota bacterium]